MVQIVGVQKPPQVYVVRLLHAHFSLDGELIEGELESTSIHEDDDCCLPVYGLDETIDSHVLDSLSLSRLSREGIERALEFHRAQKSGTLSYRLMLSEGEAFENFKDSVHVGSPLRGNWKYVKASDTIERSISHQAARRTAVYVRKE